MFNMLTALTHQLQDMPIPQSTSSPPTAKFNPPTMFTGKASDAKEFINDILNSITLQPCSFSTDLEKSIYISTFFSSFFLNHIYCARGILPKLHITASGGYWRGSEKQAQIKPGLTYESHVGPFSPSHWGDSSKCQAIPACFLHTPQ